MTRLSEFKLTKTMQYIATPMWLLFLFSFSAFNAHSGQLSFLINPSSALQQKAYYEMVSDFEKQNPAIKVKIIARKPIQFKSDIKQFTKTGQAPADIMMAYAGIQLRELQHREHIAPLDHIWPDGRLKKLVSKGSLKAIEINKQVYALPLSYYQWGIYFNKAVFQRYNITAPKTLPELLEVITRLRDKNITPFSYSANSPWTLLAWLDYLNLRINGSEFHQDLLAGKISFHDKRMTNVLDWWRKLLIAEAFHKTSNLTWEQSLPYIYRDLTAMTLMGNFFLAQVPAQQQEKLSFMPFPYSEKTDYHSEDVPLDVLILAKHAAENADAQQFLRFVSDVKTQEKFNHKVGKISPHIKSKVQADQFIKAGRTLLENADSFNHYFDRETPPEFANAVAGALVASVRDEEKASDLAMHLESIRLKYLVTK